MYMTTVNIYIYIELININFNLLIYIIQSNAYTTDN